MGDPLCYLMNLVNVRTETYTTRLLMSISPYFCFTQGAKDTVNRHVTQCGAELVILEGMYGLDVM